MKSFLRWPAAEGNRVIYRTPSYLPTPMVRLIIGFERADALERIAITLMNIFRRPRYAH